MYHEEDLGWTWELESWRNRVAGCVPPLEAVSRFGRLITSKTTCETIYETLASPNGKIYKGSYTVISFSSKTVENGANKFWLLGN